MMTRKLSQLDQAAIDLLLDRAANAGDGSDKLVMVAGAVAEERIAAVQRIVSVLDAMPAIEPPADLVTRTLSGIARATNSTFAQPQSFIDPTQPTA